MSVLKIPAEDALVLYQEQPSDPVNGIRYVETKFYSEYRWGINWQLVVQDILTEKYYSTIVQQQIGDHWYLSLEEFGPSTAFDEVERVPVVTYEYRKSADVER